MLIKIKKVKDKLQFVKEHFVRFYRGNIYANEL